MSYQRWSEGDAYVIGIEDGLFWCVGCHKGQREWPIFLTYRDIITHLQTAHDDSALAVARLIKEADATGYDAGWAK